MDMDTFPQPLFMAKNCDNAFKCSLDIFISTKTISFCLDQFQTVKYLAL